MQTHFRQSFESWVAGLRRLLETWSPCSRPFAILPVSAVSDAQKLATGNFLCVRACFLVTFCTMQKVTTRSPSQGASRFCKPQISPPQPQLRTATIKTFAGRFKVLQTLFQRTKTPTSHRTKANEQSHISSAPTYCELAVKQLFFEKHRSCVCTTVTLSHRFKAFSPAFCGQNRFRQKSPENFANSLPAEL